MIIDHLPGRTLRTGGEEYLFFSGTAYLGIGHQPAFRTALAEGVAQYGTIFSASRNNNLQLAIYDEAEKWIAQWTGAEAALTVTSGLLAGQLVVQNITNQRFIYAPSVHPAIWREKPTFTFDTYEHFKNEIIGIVAQESSPITICCNAIDPLKCTIYDFEWLTQLPDNQGITLVFDDSHAIGIVGTEGGGHFRELSMLAPKNARLVVIASLAKAVGIPGGVILSDSETIKNIRKNPLFVGASPIVPAYLAAFKATSNMYREALNVLNQNIILFKTLNEKWLSNFRFYENYPVFYSSKNGIYDFLLKHKILISSFSYPNPQDPPITRIIISALHTEGDIEKLSACLAQFFQR